MMGRRGAVSLQREVVLPKCRTGVTLILMPTKRPRHAITETPAVKAALDELRAELGSNRLVLSELVILGAQAKLEEVRTQKGKTMALRSQLADRIRRREELIDSKLADEVRRSGWTR